MMRDQMARESTITYMTVLIKLAPIYNFGDNLRDRMVRGRIVLGIRDTQSGFKLLGKRNRSKKMYRNSSQSSSEWLPGTQELPTEEGFAHAVSRMAHKLKIWEDRFESSKERSEDKYDDTPLQLKFYDRKHSFKKGTCPALGKTCHKCAKSHFSSVCISRKSSIHQFYEMEDVQIVQLTELHSPATEGRCW